MPSYLPEMHSCPAHAPSHLAGTFLIITEGQADLGASSTVLCVLCTPLLLFPLELFVDPDYKTIAAMPS